MAGWDETVSNMATIKVYINPLINWIWIGGLMLMLGTLIAAWTPTSRRRESSYVIKPGALQPLPLQEASA